MRITTAMHVGYWGQQFHYPMIITPETILEMATVNGAQFCLWEKEIGSIEVGKKADLILIDFNKPHLTPSWDIVTELTRRTFGEDVDTVIIDGKVIMENREVKTVNEEEILERARELAPKVYAKAKLHQDVTVESVESSLVNTILPLDGAMTSHYFSFITCYFCYFKPILKMILGFDTLKQLLKHCVGLKFCHCYCITNFIYEKVLYYVDNNKFIQNKRKLLK